MTAAAIIAELPTLSGADLQKVRASVGFLSSDDRAPPNAFANTLFEAMRSELHYAPHFSQFSRTKRYGTWAAHLPGLLAFVEKQFKFHEMTANAQRALLRLLVHLLMDDLRGLGAPIGMGIVAANIGRLDVVFDRAFPGYMDAGLAYLIPKQLSRPR